MLDHIHELTDAQSPPHHEDSECAAVGCALLDPTGNAVKRMNLLIEPSDFFGDNDRTVFEACLNSANATGCVDVTLLHDHLAESGKLTEIGGPLTLLRYGDAVNHAIHCDHYARVTLKNSIRRQVCDHARELFAAAWEAHESLDSIQERVWMLWECLCSRITVLRIKDREQEGLE